MASTILHILNVGHGNSAVLEEGEHRVLFDAGPGASCSSGCTRRA